LQTKSGEFARRYNRAIQVSDKDRVPGTSPPGVKQGFPMTCGFYPEIAQVLHEQGVAIVHICIGKDGHLEHAPTMVRSSGVPRLDAAALRYAAATSGQWVPARRNGRPAGVCANLQVRFVITKPGAHAGLPMVSPRQEPRSH